MRSIARTLFALTVVAASFLGGTAVGSLNEGGWPTTVTVTDKSSRRTECGSEFLIAYRDHSGATYQGQVVGPDAWKLLMPGDELPARKRWAGDLVSVSVSGPRSK